MSKEEVQQLQARLGQRNENAKLAAASEAERRRHQVRPSRKDEYLVFVPVNEGKAGIGLFKTEKTIYVSHYTVSTVPSPFENAEWRDQILDITGNVDGKRLFVDLSIMSGKDAYEAFAKFLRSDLSIKEVQLRMRKMNSGHKVPENKAAARQLEK